MATTPQIQRTNLKLILFVRNKTSVIRNKHSFSPEELGILAKLRADAAAHLFGRAPPPQRACRAAQSLAGNLEPVRTCGAATRGRGAEALLPSHPRTGNPWWRASEGSLPFPRRVSASSSEATPASATPLVDRPAPRHDARARSPTDGRAQRHPRPRGSGQLSAGRITCMMPSASRSARRT